MSDRLNSRELAEIKRLARKRRISGIRKFVAVGASLIVAAYGTVVFVDSVGGSSPTTASTSTAAATATTTIQPDVQPDSSSLSQQPLVTSQS